MIEFLPLFRATEDTILVPVKKTGTKMVPSIETQKKTPLTPSLKRKTLEVKFSFLLLSYIFTLFILILKSILVILNPLYILKLTHIRSKLFCRHQMQMQIL